MALNPKQFRFARMFALLILFAYEKGYTITFPDERESHIENSLHYIGLAKDINLFKDGIYLRKTEEYTELGEFWESIGGSWGGRFNDGNHFSLAHGGRR